MSTSTNPTSFIHTRDDITWYPSVPVGHTPFTWGHYHRDAAIQSTATPSTSQQPHLTGYLAESTSKSATTTNTAMPHQPVTNAATVYLPSNLPRPNPTSTPMPKPGQRNILITSALPYVNNIPHLGTLIGCVLSADVYARYCRLRGYNTLLICGTDEYGTATETKALELNMTPQQICDKYYAVHKEIYEYFGCQFDHFGRTSTPEQTEIVQHIFNKLDSNGFISESTIDQLYCETDQRFLADRFVEGTCHYEDCGYEDARGDQCDRCGRLIDAQKLINPRCKTCNTAPVIRTSNHLFLDLDKLSPMHREWYSKVGVGKWSANAVSITDQWLAKGLEPRCITRDLKWGVPVPITRKGFEKKVFYVWFDACIGYISITAEHTKDWKKWWYNPQDVELVQFMGKDNVPFHSTMFPSSKLGTKEPWTMLNQISTTEFLNYEGGKFSKSRNIGVFGDDVQKTGIAIEVWRYYLLSNRPETQDSNFYWSDFAARNNAELLNNVGNLCNRTLKYVVSAYDSVVPAAHSLTDAETELITDINVSVTKYIEAMERLAIRDALRHAMELSTRCNKYVQDCKAWDLFKTDRQRADTVVNVTVNCIALVALILESHMPSFAHKVYTQLNWKYPDTALQTADNTLTYDFKLQIPGDHRIGSVFAIFRRIDDTEVERLRTEFNEKSAVPVMPLDLCIGYIVDVQQHPKVASMYVLTVDIGKEKRTVVMAGLSRFYTPQQLTNKAVVYLNNIKPQAFKGIDSAGTILVGVKGSTHVNLLTIDPAKHNKDANIPAGTSITARNCKRTIGEQPFDYKTEIKQLPLGVSENGGVTFKNQPFIVSEGDVHVVVDNYDTKTNKGWTVQ